MIQISQRQPHQEYEYYPNKQPPLQEKLQSETDLTLEFAIKAGQIAEATRQQVELLHREPKEVNFIKSEKTATSQRKNNRMQILFIFILPRPLPRIQPNLQHITNATILQTNMLRKSCRMTLTHQHLRKN